MTKLDRARILAYRYQVNGLEARLPVGKLDIAARPGLQDSAPRSAVISLHARVDGVAPDDWGDDALVQVFGPRGAIYVVPNEDRAVFTLGLLPRDPDVVAELEKAAKQVIRVLDKRPRSESRILNALPKLGGVRELRWAATTGWFLPMWDASTAAVYPAEPAEADAEECRVELARRFFHYFGPNTTKGLQWWLGSSKDDAMASTTALAGELATLEVAGEEVLMLAEDFETARNCPHPSGVHLLPPEDPYINRLCGPVLAPDPSLHSRLYPRGRLPGALVLDGEVVATWRRRARRITMVPWPGCPVGELTEPVAASARNLPLPGEPDNTVVDWYAD